MPDFYLYDEVGTLRFRLIGHLGGNVALDFERSWKTASSTLGGRVAVVDLSEVESADPVGREVLRRVGAAGAKFVTANALGDSLARDASGRVYREMNDAPQGLWKRVRCWFGCCCRAARATMRKCVQCGRVVRRIW